MLRPATPLAVIFLVAFVLLLLGTLSTPIIQAIPLGSYDGTTFGVFGYCGSSGCISPTIGYTSDVLPSGTLSAGARHSLSFTLIVHPIAAFLALVCLILAIAAHFHAPSHSPRFLLALLILTIPTLLVSLLAFLVDILLFVPHVAWGTWIVLAATILIVASSVMTCAMRRTLVSRKARKKRIAENADMSGANYYDNLAASRAAAAQRPIPAPEVAPSTTYEYPRADSPPPMENGAAKGGFSTYEMQSQDARSTDDRTPLNPSRDGRDGSVRSASTGRRAPPYGPGEAPPMPMNGRPSVDSNGRPRAPSRDQYGNPIPAGAFYGEMPPPPLRHRSSQGSMGSNGSASRGRGGYGPPRGGMPPQRGGMMPPRGAFRGGPPPPGWRGRGRGGYGPPPRGYGPPRGRGGYPPRGGYGPPPPGMMRSPPPPEYVVDSPYYDVAGGQQNAPVSPIRDQMPQEDRFVARPDVPIGTAIEMDERHGSPRGPLSPEMAPRELSPQYPDHVNAIGAAITDGPVGAAVPAQANTYVSPRSQWSHEDAITSTNAFSRSPPPGANLPPSPIRASPMQMRPGHARTGSESYYEDVDPRFAVDEPQTRAAALPSVLTPGGMPPGTMEGTPGGFPRTPGPENGERFLDHSQRNSNPNNPTVPDLVLPTNNSSFEHIPEGARSPAEGSERMSEASHFTSISQRGINPNWQPGPGFGGPASSAYGGGAAASSASAVQRRRDDMILGANPDFSIPGVGALRGGRPGRARGPSLGGGNGVAGGMGSPSRGATLGAGGVGGGGLTPMGRYPTDI